MTAARWIKKALLVAGVVLLIFSGTTAVLSYIYSDELVDRFLSEANKRISTPVQTSAIDVSWWEKFPQISLALRDVVIDGSLPGPTDTLGVAEKIYCTFDVLDILMGNWEVDQIHMENGRLLLVYSELGDNNYTIIKKDTTRESKGVGFNLQKILLDKVDFTYIDLRRNQEYQLWLEDLEASLYSKDNRYDIELHGQLESRFFRYQEKLFLADKPMGLKALLEYSEPEKLWEFKGTTIELEQSEFELTGWYQGNDSSSLDITLGGKETDVQTILSLLPEEISRPYRAYRSKGDVYFQARLTGSTGDQMSPEINIDFGCKKASLFHPRYQKAVTNLTLKGNYYSPAANDLSTAVLSLQDIRGAMESRPFKGNLTIKNLKNYFLNGEFEGTLDLASWQKFLPPGKITEAQGTMTLDVAFKGPVEHLNTSKAVDNFSTTGSVALNEVDFSVEKNNLPFKNFNGHFMFDGRDLAISDFKGEVGHSDFVINGLFKNIIAFIFSKNQPIGIEADLRSNNIDLDELLTGSIRAPDETVVGKQSYTTFGINPRLQLTFDCRIRRLKFRRFRGHEINGELVVQDQIAKGKNLAVTTLGGKITMQGEVNGKRKDHLVVRTNSSYDGIHLDSLFYVFENFNQEFLQDRHLKGQAHAEIVSSMAFDSQLRFKSDQLVVDAGLIIENGELNNFTPMQKLSSFVERTSLANMTFGDLKNDIHIEDRMIYLPNMLVQSNVTDINVTGTHSFDQDIDYRLKVPLKNHKKDKDSYFGALEDDGSNTNLYLKIVGNTRDYRVVYDKKAVKNKIQQDLREEKWEFRKAVRTKGADENTQELNEEEFFDFSETDSTAMQ